MAVKTNGVVIPMKNRQKLPTIEQFDELKVVQPSILEYDNTKIEAFNPDDDILAGVPKEKLLDELNLKETDNEKVKGKIMLDGITGEQYPAKKIDDDSIPNVEALQDITPEEIRRQLNKIAKTHMTLLIPDKYSDEEVEKIIAILEEKLINTTHEQINEMTSDEIKEFIGKEVYEGIKVNTKSHVVKTSRQFLLDMKNSIVEANGLINTLDEIKNHMSFFEKLGIEQVQKDIRNSVNSESDKYVTELHKYIHYLELYIDKLKTYKDHQDDVSLKKEIKISEDRIKAVNEALSFERIINRAKNNNDKIIKDFKDQNGLKKLIHDFIGKLNSDPDIVISFPVPKHMMDTLSKDIEQFTGVWLLFLELIDMRNKFRVLHQITHADYYMISEILITGKYDITDERSKFLNQFIIDNKIAKINVEDSKKMAIILTYFLAKAFKPGRMKSTYDKYVLSYTMNILSQGLKEPYSEMFNELVSKIVNIIKK
ncbi:MAG: hypothetical protein KGZ74_19470 [Chitinophagaceae bacterium]|nr:hypothetical protein [Chitinophagaceae bacterium]